MTERPRPGPGPGPGKAEAPATEEPATEEPAGKPARPASPAAAAASRARRIGGRVSGGATTQPAQVPDREPSEGRAVQPAKESRGERAERKPMVLPRWLRWLPATALSAGAAAMIALLVVFSHGVWWAKPSGNALREQIVAAAKTCVAKTNTYDYTKLAAYQTQVHACTTGALTGQIDKTITTVIKKYAPTLKAKQTAQINRGAIETIAAGGKQWTLLIFGQLSVTNTNYPSGRTDPFAAQVRMQKVHGKWLMSSLETVSTPLS